MTEFIIVQVNKAELKNIVEEVIRFELQRLPGIETFHNSEEYLTREETSKLLKISLPTLNEYTKKGVIEGYRLGTLVRYKRAEIEASLKLIPNIKYKRLTTYSYIT